MNQQATCFNSVVVASMLDADSDSTAKVIVCGDGGVGKSSLLKRFVKGEFSEQSKMTIGAAYFERRVLTPSRRQMCLNLWDTAGQERFHALTSMYYRGADACVLAYSTTDAESFRNVEAWRARVLAAAPECVFALCETKVDLAASTSVIDPHEAESLARRLEAPLWRVSAKNDHRVSELFEQLAERLLRRDNDRQQFAEAAARATQSRSDDPPRARVVVQVPSSMSRAAQDGAETASPTDPIQQRGTIRIGLRLPPKPKAAAGSKPFCSVG